MNQLVTWALAAVIAAQLVEGLARRDRAYQFPFLAAAMAFAFILPQAPGVAADPFLPEGGYVKVGVVAILCLLCLRLGWSERGKPLAMFGQTYNEARLLLAAAVLSAAGAVFYVKISRLPSELVVGVQMSGAPVIYMFFSRLLIYGLAIAALCFARRPTLASGAIVAFDLVLCLDRILVTGKRAEALELALIAGLALWFQRRWVAPRSLVLAILLGGAFVMSSMSDYRDITRRTGSFDWQSIKNIDVVENFQQLLKSGGPELANAAVRISNVDRLQIYDYGAIHWNRLVLNYVPAQIIGSAAKESLLIIIPPQERDYQPLTGTTETGMVDAFQSFWYFGALKFLLLSYVISRLWVSAMAGSTTAQIIYMLSIVPAMHAVSHLTDWVVSVWVHMVIFLLPALLLARLPPRQSRQLAVAPPATGLRPVILKGA